MTDDELRELTAAFSGELLPMREILDRMMTVIERLTNRVEVLELERWHGHADPRPPANP